MGDPFKEFVLQDTRIKLKDFLPEWATLGSSRLCGIPMIDKTADYDFYLMK